MPKNEYLIEKRLYDLDPELHKRFSDSIFVLLKLLNDYTQYFPEYTDHAETHSLCVIENCNKLMGEEMICQMNADELYVLLMGCYLHDVGMGVSMKDYIEFCERIDFGDYFETHVNPEERDVIRAFHNEFSACFIYKYASLFDFPSEKHLFAVSQTARGHRNADLYDEKWYPDHIDFDNGNRICLPYLAAIVRMGDEVNVDVNRNTKLLFDPEKATTDTQRMENAKHEAIKRMNIYPDRIELDVQTDDPKVYEAVEKLSDKVQKELDYCVRVVAERTDHEITQKKVVILGRNC